MGDGIKICDCGCMYDSPEWPYCNRVTDKDRIKQLEAELEYWRKDSADAWDKCEENRVKLAELLVVVKRAVRLSLDHSDFKLYAMEPLERAIAAAELTGQDDE